MEKNYNNGVGGQYESDWPDYMSPKEKEACQRMSNKLTAESFGFKNEYSPNGYTQGDLYRMAGKCHYVSTITFRRGSESEKKYGDSLTGIFIYTIQDQLKLNEDRCALDNDPYVRIEQLDGIQDEAIIKELREKGVCVKDIVEIFYIPV